MNKVLGWFILLSSIVIGLYLGVYVMFIGGIIQIVESITPEIYISGILLGLLRVICSSFVGWLSFYILFSIGMTLQFNRK